MWLWIIATLLAFFVKGLSGFANTLVFTSVLGFGVNNVDISPIDLVLGFPSNAIIAFRNRKHIKAKICVPLIVLLILGSLPGAFILKNVDAQLLKIVFGAVVIFIGIDILCREYGLIKLKKSKLAIGTVGVLAGLMCGMFGVGALMAACIGAVTDTAEEFKANICMIFTVENTIRLVTYIVLGVITIGSLKQTIIIVPFMFMGLYLGMLCSKHINEKTAKIVIIILLIISGSLLIFKNL